MNEQPSGAESSADETGDTALTPEAMLTLLEDQRRSVEGQIASFVPAIILSWGITWLVGFGALWLIDGLRPAFALPLPVAVTIFVVLLAGSIVLSAVMGARSGRGLRGNSDDAFQGTVYGATWTIGSIAIYVFALGLTANGMDRELANIYYPVAFVLFTGIMYILSAAMWRAIPMLILGVWTIVVGLAAPFVGYPTHYLLLAVGGGVGFLVLAVASYIHLARLRRATTPDSGADRRAVRRG